MPNAELHATEAEREAQTFWCANVLRTYGVEEYRCVQIAEALLDDGLVSEEILAERLDEAKSMIASLRARLDAVSDLADHLTGNEVAPLIREALNGYAPTDVTPPTEGI